MTVKKYSTAIFAAMLALLVLAVYWQTVGFELINLDDLSYTVLNPTVKDGLTFSGIKEALTSIQLRAYMPVPLLSYMADVQAFGLKPSGFHFTNNIIHLLNTLLLFAFLYRSTGTPWKSFFVAALWAIHPLRAESVAWVAERKDVLAGFFFLTGLIAYGEYGKKRSLLLYVAALLAMLLGLLSKSVLVVFPLVLLISDFWPLERANLQRETIRKLLIEKIPFFVLAAFFSAMTLYIQKDVLHTQGQKPVMGRLADMATAYSHYLRETVWPFGLVMDDRSTAVHLTGPIAFGAGLLILVLTLLAWRIRKLAPAVTAGWLWYLVVLFPTSGVVLLDFYFVADHFTYLPHIGLMVALVWGAGYGFGKLFKNPKTLAIAGAMLVITLSVFCYRQVSLWKDDFTFFGYIDKMTGGQSAMAKKSLGIAYYDAGKYQEAYDNYSMALQIFPGLRKVPGYKGAAAAKLGRYREAIELYRLQLRSSPGDKDFSLMIVEALIEVNDLPGAARQALENIRRWPNDTEAWQAILYLGGEAKARAIAGR